MMSNIVTNQKINTNLIVKKKSLNNTDLYSFLTNFESNSLNNKITYPSPNLLLVSRITSNGKIKFCNSDFCTVIKTSAKDIQNKKLTNTFHPEMPKVVLNYIKDSLAQNKDAIGVIKQIDNNGNTIWLNSQFTPNQSNKLNIACYIKSVPSSKKTIEEVEKIYNTVFLLENHVGFNIAQKYFEGLLEMEYGDYNGFMVSIFE